MQETRVEKRAVTVVAAVVCSVCKKRYAAEDIVEQQEMVTVEDIGGFGSLHGDGRRWRIDICQHCLLEHLGQYIEYSEPS